MKMKKTIICFANSRKHWGYCFAGKDIDDKKWYRPVSNCGKDSLSKSEECIRNAFCVSKAKMNTNFNDLVSTRDKSLLLCTDCNPTLPEVLDIIEIEFSMNQPFRHQIENYTFEPQIWKKIATFNLNIDNYLDNNISQLWINGYQKGNKKNDCIPVSLINNIVDSLKLIEVNSLRIVVSSFNDYETGSLRKKVAGKFTFKNQEYIIAITDIKTENEYKSYRDGIYEYPNLNKRIILCISLGLEFDGYIYKLISGLFLI